MAECWKLWEVLRDEPMWMAVYRVLLSTGMRQGELRALRWGDVDFTRQVIHINRTMTITIDGKSTVGTATKMGEGRTVPLPPYPLAALKAWYETKTLRPMNPERDFVFGLRPGSPLNLSTWQTKHNEIIARAGIRRIKIHGTRHTYATLAMESGVHPKVVQEALGHSRIQTTLDRYSHVSVSLQRAASEKLDALMGGEVEREREG